MRLPVLKQRNKYKRRIVAFGGINLTSSFSEGEMRDISGISHENFPFLSQTKAIAPFFKCTRPSFAHSSSELVVAAEDGFYYGGKKIGELGSGNKIIAEIGNKIVIFPDKLYYDVTEKRLLPMDGKICLSGTRVTYSEDAITIEEPVYETISTVETSFFSPEFKVFKYTDVSVKNGNITYTGKNIVEVKDLKPDDCFYEASVQGKYRLVYSSEVSNDRKIKITGELVTVDNISSKIFASFRPGDVVEISESNVQQKTIEAKILEVTETSLKFPAGTFKEGYEDAAVIIKRKIPDLSCVCVYENRLWGCEGKTIYASKLGDPLNFHSYSGVSTDSFSVESNSEGKFTAVTSYGNCCLFFKKNKCYKLFGNKPSNFSLTECFGEGISENDKNSIVKIDGRIIYRGSGGVYAFYGGLPECISDKLSGSIPENCVGGASRNCYYMSGDINGVREEYVYNLKNGLWTKSGIRDVIGYLTVGEDLYRLMADGLKKTTEDIDSDKEWYAEFCPFSENYHKEKKYSRFYITANMDEGSWIKAEIKRDDALWETVKLKHSLKKEYINIPCTAQKCHEVSLRLSGKGKCVIESVVREFSVN